jgi:hypothetical protein
MKRLFAFILSTLWIIGVAAQEAPVKWLTKAPDVAQGQNWGIPWPKGKVKRNQVFVLKTSSGKILPLQTWPLAYWPDGSIKWCLKGTQCLRAGNWYVRSKTAVNLNNPEPFAISILREIHQMLLWKKNEPIRTVVKIAGSHWSADNQREWLPFTVRFYFYAGQSTFRMVHSIVFDGDQQNDYIKGLGVVFQVPFREEVQNRHVSFSEENGGLWAEPIQPLDGRRMIAHPEMTNPYRSQLAGERIPDKATFTTPNQKLLTDFAVWDGFKLAQTSTDGFIVTKRTGTESSWLAAGADGRSEGLVYVGDVSGGLAINLKNFWQSYPVLLEVQKVRSQKAQTEIWIWSPEAQAMDLRHYDTIAHDLNSTYEDVQEGLSTPFGVAHTSELTEMMFELLSFLDNKDFMKVWLEYCEYYSMPKEDLTCSSKNANLPTNSFRIPRLTAYAAKAKEDPKLADRVWSEFLGRMYGSRSMYATQKVSPPEVLNPLDENRGVGTNGVAQWGLNGIFLPGMIGDLSFSSICPIRCCLYF